VGLFSPRRQPSPPVDMLLWLRTKLPLQLCDRTFRTVPLRLSRAHHGLVLRHPIPRHSLQHLDRRRRQVVEDLGLNERIDPLAANVETGSGATALVKPATLVTSSPHLATVGKSLAVHVCWRQRDLVDRAAEQALQQR